MISIAAPLYVEALLAHELQHVLSVSFFHGHQRQPEVVLAESHCGKSCLYGDRVGLAEQGVDEGQHVALKCCASGRGPTSHSRKRSWG